MLADLHTHSYHSDGTDSPAELVRAAVAAGLDVVALTDHDSAEGWDEARRVARDLSIGFVPGVEVSCMLDDAGVHLLAYGPDPAHPGLAAELTRVLAARERRLPAVLGRLRGLGIDLDEADVRGRAGPAAAIGRPHVADALVAAGVVADRDQAFAQYLMPGRPAFVPRYAAPLTDMLRLVAAAGGVSVLAHPWSRSSRRVLTPRRLAELVPAGLTGWEVWHRDHSDRDRRALSALARDLGQVQTGASDYHGAGKVAHPLGCCTTPPDQLDRLLDALAAAADRARSQEPEVHPAPVTPPP